jgi:N-acetylmuramoyl-L-alanine amidase
MMFTKDSPLTHACTPSPNYGERKGKNDGKGDRKSALIDLIVLHYTGMKDGPSALARLCDPISEVSAHYLVEENGKIHQLVPENKRSWHAGAGCWHGSEDINSRSIGIEIVNGGHAYLAPDGTLPLYPDVQTQAVIALCKDICARWHIPPEGVLAHSDIAPLRKQDPGEHFPWEALYHAGVGHWVPPAPLCDGRFLTQGDEGSAVEALQMMLRLYGYGIEAHGRYDAQTQAVVRAFQRHFRPIRVDGIADSATISTLHALLKRLP